MKVTIFKYVILMVSMTAVTVPLSAQDKPGAQLVAELCTKCHNLDEVVRLRQDREAWSHTVYSMISRGAPIFPEEIDVIINYLSEAYPPAD